MTSRDDWITIIRKSKGKVSNDPNKNHRHPTIKLNFADKYTWIDAYWIYREPGDWRFKELRDRVAVEMRKDGWAVTTGMADNRLEYYLFAKKERK
jgi:hypothetical protein